MFVIGKEHKNEETQHYAPMYVNSLTQCLISTKSSAGGQSAIILSAVSLTISCVLSDAVNLGSITEENK
jgi:hypothetical protein